MSQGSTTMCPRCGYDLRGTMATWKDSCPLIGRCTECGLDFEWADLFDRTRKAPAWCIEYARRGPRSITRAIVITFLQSCLPWRFWHRLRLHHPVRFPRLALYACATFVLPAVLLYIAIQAAAAYIVCNSLHAEVRQARLDTKGMIAGYQRVVNRWEVYQSFEEVPEGDLDGPVRQAQLYRTARIDGERIERWQIPPRDQQEWENLQEDVLRHARHGVEWQTDILNRMEIDLSMPRLMVAAILTPPSTEPIGHKRTYGSGLTPITPRELHGILFVPQNDWLWFTLWKRMGDAAGSAMMWLASVIVFPMLFMLLPLSMRSSRMRAVHIARIAIYGAWIPVLVFWIAAAIVARSITVMPRSLTDQGEMPALLIDFGPLPLMLAWWYCAIRWHLRLRRPLLITMLLAIVTALVLLGGVYLLFGFDLRSIALAEAVVDPAIPLTGEPAAAFAVGHR
jgi:hypothetical protein